MVDDGFTMCSGCENVVEATPWCGRCGTRIDAVAVPSRQRICKPCQKGFTGRYCGGCGRDYGEDITALMAKGQYDADKDFANLTARVTPGLTALWKDIRKAREQQ